MKFFKIVIPLTFVVVLMSSFLLLYYSNKNKIIVLIENNEVSVKHKLTDDENIIIVYNQNRTNDFFDMSKFIIQDNNAEKNDFTGETVMSTSTDFISPYGLLSVNNGINNKQFTVGGAHGSEGSKGLPTGEFGEIEYIKIDDKTIQKDGIYEGNKLKIKVNHFVYASNTIAEKQNTKSLKEVRFYSISNGDHEVEVKLTALEDIILTRYAGLQMTQPSFYESFYFPGLNNIYKIKGEPPGLYTLKEKSYDKLDSAVLYNSNSMLVMMTDRNYGIGNGRYATKSTFENPQSPLTYTGGEFGKIYSHNLGRNNANLTLEKAETVSYRGGYYFREMIQKDKNKITYEINNKVYTDFIN